MNEEGLYIAEHYGIHTIVFSEMLDLSPTRLRQAEPAITRFFEENPRRVFSWRDIAEILSQHRETWNLGGTTKIAEFIEFLGKIKLVTRQLRSDKYAAITRYTWGDVSVFEIGQCLRNNSYLSHGTAAFLHALTDQSPSVIYANKEQSQKPQSKPSSLTQSGLDQAFRRRHRQSAYVYKEGTWRFILLSGKQTGNLQVGSMVGPTGEQLLVTKLERTLIDIVVRPAYAGGVYEVKRAFESAKDRLDPNLLLQTLQALNYVYPYHQAIGFYLERTGYPPSVLDLFASRSIRLNFYLAHAIDAAELDPRWKLFHPKGF